MTVLMKLTVVLCAIMFFGSCGKSQWTDRPDYNLNKEFGAYWHQGLAELASYRLEQVRYGEIREGHAVLIFVTEDFSKSLHVKLDDPGKNDSDILKVLKLNSTRKFKTGIYPYSTMTSVFTPIYQNTGTVKHTSSIQEWCGQTFLQANLRNGSYKVQGNSYFQSEGDLNYELADVQMEDELWNLIRLDYKALPTGTFKLLPGSIYCRFKHVDYRAYEVEAKLERLDDKRYTYLIKYPELERTLKITFNADFPHEILGWEETYPENGKFMTTKASLIAVKQLDYWNRNTNEDAAYRVDLGLDAENVITD